MGCGCGKGGGNNTVVIETSSDPSSPGMLTTNTLVTMQYTGTETGTRRLRSRSNPSARYSYSADEKLFQAYQSDVDWLVSLNEFVVVEEDTSASSSVISDLPALESSTQAPSYANVPVDRLGIDPVITATLKKNGIDTIDILQLISDADLLSIKGLGAKRVQDIRKALDVI